MTSNMSPIEIRGALEQGGYDLSQHANALASIHGVLKRLAEGGEVESLPHEVRGTLYRGKYGTKVSSAPAGAGDSSMSGNSPSPPKETPHLQPPQLSQERERRKARNEVFGGQGSVTSTPLLFRSGNSTQRVPVS